MKKEEIGYKYYIDKPWGYELIISRHSSDKIGSKGETVHKILVILTNQELSYQVHKYRHEIWEIKSGDCEISIDGTIYTKVLPGTIWIIEPEVKHSIKAITPTVIDEVSTNYIDSDIVRLEDKYGRAK